jgi:DNA invertase Pin-like site-specific DNA recombinase
MRDRECLSNANDIYGIDFISLSPYLDTSTAAGKMVVEILGAIVEMDRGNHREAIRMGIEGARRAR